MLFSATKESEMFNNGRLKGKNSQMKYCKCHDNLLQIRVLNFINCRSLNAKAI